MGANRYKFKIARQNYRVGDLVPETYGRGVIETMLQAQVIEPAEADEGEHAKNIEAPPADKQFHPTAKTRRKAAV